MISRLRRSLTTKRITEAIKHLSRGEFAYVKQRIRSNLFPSALPDVDLGQAMAFFRKEMVEVPPLDQKIDIIIPIHNGMPYLTKLFDSLFSKTDSPYRLILVDDASTDGNIHTLLHQIAEKRSGTVLLRNEANLGFVQSVNLGAKHAQNHFVILNTDVEVPSDWLQRLIRPIVENDKVASTTPFTNSRTICGFPLRDRDNEIFDGMTVDDVDAVFKRIDTSAASIQLPTAVGFCMGVNLNAWRQVGPFNDRRALGCGYGEKGDWSFRATRAGYRHVMVSNLFVYHKHCATFDPKEKQGLLLRNTKKLVRLHPSSWSSIGEFAKRDPTDPIRRFALLLLSAQASKSRTTLLIDHSVGGGANVYSRMVIEQQLREGRAILLLTYDIRTRLLKLISLYREYKVAFSLSSLDDLVSLLQWVPCRDISCNNLVSFPKPLEVVRMMCHLKHGSNCSLTVMLHDFYPICPSYNLLNAQGQFCNLPDPGTCRACLPQNPYVFERSKDSYSIDVWRREWQNALILADVVLCFSESSMALLNKVYTLRPEQIVVRPHELPTHFPRKAMFNMSTPLNIGVVGSIGYHKGSRIVVEAAKVLAQRAPKARITVIGTLDSKKIPRNVKVTGPYQPGELPHLLEKYRVNMCFFPSIWPETFSYVCSELMELGMPLCCYDLGAQGERVRQYEMGHVISQISPDTTVAEVMQFYTNLENGLNRDRIGSRSAGV